MRQHLSLGRSLLGVAMFVLVRAAASSEPSVAPPEPRPPRPVDLTAADGTVLKATFFAAAAPGPGAILFEQSNRDRNSWAGVARQLAAAGIHTLTLDMRGHGETGGAYDKSDREKGRQARLGDLDTAFRFLTSQPGVHRDAIGLGGAGAEGVDNAVRTAMRHPDQIKSLALLSGETVRDGLQFLREASRLPALFVVADDDEYPPTVEALELLYLTDSSPSKKLVHYAAAQEAPWLWYEPLDVGRVAAHGGHGTDLFAGHVELPGIIVDWFVTTLLRTPGHAPADTLACAATLDEIRARGGVARVRQRLLDARKTDPEAQLFPEITASIIGFDHQRANDAKEAVEVLELVLLAYPTAAAHENLSEAYLQDGQKDLARRHAEKSLELLDARTAPASSWSDTDEFRGEIRHGAQGVLAHTGR
jgi:dienelactone hydrolase